MTYTVETVEVDGIGNYRARIVEDTSGVPPVFEGGIPIYSVEHTRSRGYAACHAYGEELSDTAAALEAFADRFGFFEGVKVFDRYLGIFHGGAAVRLVSGVDWNDWNYVAFLTREVWEGWGNSDNFDDSTAAECASEWQAYLDGETYGIVVERRVLDRIETYAWGTAELAAAGLSRHCRTVLHEEFVERWEEVNSCWGFYGDLGGYVTDEARGMIREFAGAESA